MSSEMDEGLVPDEILQETGELDEKQTEKKTAEWERKIRKRAKDLVYDLENGYMELAEILYHVYDKPKGNVKQAPPLFVAWGYTTFEKYVNEELGFSIRKAQSLRLIWFRLEVELKDLDEGLRARLLKLGWTKVRELTRILSLENAAEWVAKVEDRGDGKPMSFSELESAVSEYRNTVQVQRLEAQEQGDDPKAVAPGVPMTEKPGWKHFMLAPDQFEVVSTALDRAEQLSGSDKEGNNLTLICTDFLSTNDFLTASGEAKLRYLAKIEQLIGLRLVVINPDCNQVLHGMESLDKLAKAGE